MTTINESLTAAMQAADRVHRYEVSSQAYGHVVQEGILHALIALGLLLDGQDKASQAIPGLPEGYQLTTEQSAGNDRKWRFALLSRDGVAWVSRYKWDSSETALTGGLRAARQHDETGVEPRP